MIRFAEFFAGGGMARIGLGPSYSCRLAVEWCQTKAASYAANFPDAADHLVVDDVWKLDAVPDVDLFWGSSPCQDLSLAGERRGLAGGKSSAFWGMWRWVERKRPRCVVIENVEGLLTSNNGADLRAVGEVLAAAGYDHHVFRLDARHWLPQSRPRVFIVGFQTSCLQGEAWAKAKEATPPPPPEDMHLAEVLEPADAVEWFSAEATARYRAMMTPPHRQRFAERGRGPGAGFRRGRGVELRFDGLAGCLRTPAGGSSKQLIADSGRLRWLTPREAARLMGLAESYRLPASKIAALHLCGDGVAVPTVAWLRETVLDPVLTETRTSLA